MQKNKFNSNFLVLVLIIILGIFIFTFHNTIMALNLPIIHWDLDFEGLFSQIINGLRNLNLNDLMIMLSNLEYLQDLVGVPQNGYDINNVGIFFEMLLQCQNLSVELIDGVYVNCITVNNIIYTVHPDFIDYILKLFIILDFLIFLIIKYY